jgi:Ca2+-binding RTX toxin-like protein
MAKGFKSGNLPGNKYQGKGWLFGTEQNDHIMGTKGADVVNAGGGNDVVIGYAGNDMLVGGTGADNLSGGLGNDVLVGGSWADGDSSSTIDFAEVTGDADVDVYVGGSSFADNGTDTIMGYQAEDRIDLGSGLGVAFEQAYADAGYDAAAAWDALVQGGYVSLAGGALVVDQDGSAGLGTADTWFVVNAAGESGWAGATSVVVLVGGNAFTLNETILV